MRRSTTRSTLQTSVANLLAFRRSGEANLSCAPRRCVDVSQPAASWVPTLCASVLAVTVNGLPRPGIGRSHVDACAMNHGDYPDRALARAQMSSSRFSTPTHRPCVLGRARSWLPSTLPSAERATAQTIIRPRQDDAERRSSGRRSLCTSGRPFDRACRYASLIMESSRKFWRSQADRRAVHVRPLARLVVDLICMAFSQQRHLSRPSTRRRNRHNLRRRACDRDRRGQRQ